MSSVGFQSQFPTAVEFLASQGALIDTNLLMVIVGAMNAESVSKSIAAQALRLSGLMSQSGELSFTEAQMSGMAEKIAKSEIDAADAKSEEWTQKQQENPVPSIGKKPNLDSWDDTHPLTYSDDADAEYLKERGLSVSVYVPAQTKVVQVPNPRYAELVQQIAAKQQELAAAPPEQKPAILAQIAALTAELLNTPQQIDKTLTAPQIGSPSAYEENKETIAEYKESLENGTADNKVINKLTEENSDLKAIQSDLEAFGATSPVKFKEIGTAVVQLGAFGALLQNSIGDARAELMSFVDKATSTYAFLDNLGRDLAAGGRREIDKIQKRTAALDDVDLSPLDAHTRAIVEDVLSKLANATPVGDVSALVQALSAEQQKEVQAQTNAFQNELEALRGFGKSPEESPKFPPSSRLMRV
jgi:hypothetical protein